MSELELIDMIVYPVQQVIILEWNVNFCFVLATLEMRSADSFSLAVITLPFPFNTMSMECSKGNLDP